MKVAKPTADILKGVSEFAQAAEELLERGQFDLKSPYEKWEDWDEDDDDKKLMLRIRRGIAATEDVEEEDIDGRILAYEFLRSKYKNRLSHVILAANVLLDNCCDPTEDCLEFRPDIYFQHVAPEQ